jgi:hypothetical protein
MSYASTTQGEEKENGRGGALSPSLRSESGRQSSGSGDHESWKRAAEVTSQLKLRIEVGLFLACVLGLWSCLLVCFWEQQMKAKQGLSGRGTPQY